MAEVDALDATLDSVVAAIAHRDAGGLLGRLATRDDVAILGSEVGEVARGHEAVREFVRDTFARPAGFRFELAERSWSVVGDVAWVVADGTVGVHSSGQDAVPYRLTAVFVREATDWRLALWSGAEPQGEAGPAAMAKP